MCNGQVDNHLGLIIICCKVKMFTCVILLETFVNRYAVSGSPSETSKEVAFVFSPSILCTQQTLNELEKNCTYLFPHVHASAVPNTRNEF